MNPKVIGIAAGAGFILSFLIALISRNTLLASLIKAVIFAAVGGGMAAGITVVFSKFLVEDIDFEATASAPKVGGIVDITLDDQRLPEDKNAPKFNVGSNLKSMNEAGTAEQGSSNESEPDGAEKQTSEAQVASEKENPAPAPEKSQVDLKSDSPKSAESENGGFKAMNVAAVAASAEKKPKGLDEDVVALPDIGDLGNNTDDDSANSAPPIAEMPSAPMPSAPSPKSSKGATFADGSSPSVQDAATIAQAIRTVLARES